MNILLHPNLEKANSIKCTAEILQILRRLSAVAMLDNAHKKWAANITTGIVFGDFDNLLPKCDILMPIGGDGTIINTVPYSLKCAKPIIGINTGRVGFLAQLECHELGYLKRLVTGEYKVDKRILLQVTLPDGRKFSAINDIVVRPVAWDKLVELEVFERDKLVASRRADGLIFATPTGSTAYSLSAGGPVVPPELSLIILTAICPRCAYANSLVLPATEKYRVSEKTSTNTSELSICVDGVRIAKINHGDCIIIEKSDITVGFIDIGLRDFYTNFNQKLI